MHQLTPIEDSSLAIAAKILQDLSRTYSDAELNKIANLIQEARGKYGEKNHKAQ